MAAARLAPAYCEGLVSADGYVEALLEFRSGHGSCHPRQARIADLAPAALHCSIVLKMKYDARDLLAVWARKGGCVVPENAAAVDVTHGGYHLRYPVYRRRPGMRPVYKGCILTITGDAVYREINAMKVTEEPVGLWEVGEKYDQFEAVLRWEQWRGQPESDEKKQAALEIARVVKAAHEHHGELGDVDWEEVENPDPADVVEEDEDE